MGDTKADVIYRQKGRVTTTRVLPSEGTSRRFESSIEGTGTLAGHNINGIITYTSNSVSQDSFTGVAYGILTAQEGGDTAFWRAWGASRRVAGADELIWRGYAVLESQSPKFSELHGTIFDAVAHIRDDGSVSVRFTQWK
jgi:hypothetical protein